MGSTNKIGSLAGILSVALRLRPRPSVFQRNMAKEWCNCLCYNLSNITIFIPQIFIGHLPCVGHCSRYQRSSEEQSI